MLRLISLRGKLLLALSGLLVLTLAAITWVVIDATREAADNFAQRELAVAERLFHQTLADNRRQLTDRARLLAEDFGFRRAIATGEQETLISVLANHGERIGAELVLLVAPDGKIILSSHAMQESALSFRAAIAGAEPASLLVVAEGEAFQLVLVPVMAPNLIAWVGLGFAIDLTALETLKSITEAEVALQVNGRIALSTLAVGQASETLQALEHTGAWLIRTVALEDIPADQLTAVLLVASEALARPFVQLQRQMQIIAVVTLLIAVAGAGLLARSISKPIGQLVKAAQRMAGGDYSRPVARLPGHEFGTLASAFNAMQTAIRAREDKILHQAIHDDETGMLNAYGLRQQLDAFFGEPKEFSFALLSLENYGRISDLYGFGFLRDYLPALTDQLSAQLPDDSCLARLARDQLAIVAPLSVDELQRSVQAAMAQTYEAGPVPLQWDARTGLVPCPDAAQDAEQLLRRANVALKQARVRGLPHFTYQTGMDETYLRKLNITQRLQRVLVDGGLALHYQPQRCLRTGKIVGAEALLRWRDAELGAVYPDEFIPLAEESGTIGLLTRWVLQQVQLDAGVLAGRFDLQTLGINLSASDLLDTKMIEQLLSLRAAAGSNVIELEFEITETALVQDTETAVMHLRSLEGAGISLSMDDFGTGYSSLSQLKMLPVKKLKIDKSFVLNLTDDADDQSIVKATIAMAKALSLKVVAEGVENAAAEQLLKSWGCDYVQGYHLARPMPLDRFIAWLEDENRHEKNAQV